MSQCNLKQQCSKQTRDCFYFPEGKVTRNEMGVNTTLGTQKVPRLTLPGTAQGAWQGHAHPRALLARLPSQQAPSVLSSLAGRLLASWLPACFSLPSPSVLPFRPPKPCCPHNSKSRNSKASTRPDRQVPQVAGFIQLVHTHGWKP